MKHLTELEKLNLPEDQFAVFGSGPLAIRGWRDNDDIDLIVSDSLWQGLVNKFPPVNDKEIKIGQIYIFKDWLPWFDDNNELIATADVFNGIRFVNLINVRKWKLAMGREKDLKDIELIDKYQNES